MSIGEKAARIAVALAVVLLPASMRERYSEQWRADLRDAEEAGLRRSGIAVGSLAFAATVDRFSVEARGALPAEVVRRRERLASGLALGTALLAVSHFGSIVGFGWTAGFGPLGFLVAFSTFLMAAYLTLAPVAAIVMVSATRGVARQVRWAVWLLVLASLSHPAQLLVDGGATGNVYATRGTMIYGLAVVAIVVATVLLARQFRGRTVAPTKRPVAAIVGALAVAGGVALGFANLRALLDLQRIVGADFVDRIATTSAADAPELAAGLREAEQVAVVAVAFWVVAGVAGVAALVVFGFVRGSTRLGAVARTAAVLCVLVIAHASVTTFLQLLSVGGATVFLPIPDVLLMIGRWGLIAVVLATVGGVRLRRSPEVLPGPAPDPLPEPVPGATAAEA